MYFKQNEDDDILVPPSNTLRTFTDADSSN